MNGVLLVNLGTPDSPRPRDVYRYLIEFLTDGRVIDLPWWKRQLLVRGVIVPFRYRQSAKMYSEIWTPQGSPLMIYGRRTQQLLQAQLGKDFVVALAMRYQNPSIASVLEALKEKNLRRLIVLPLFPQYASATTGSVHQRVMEELSRWEVIPEVQFVNSYQTQLKMIQAFAEAAKSSEEFDYTLFSFHGLPERQILKADRGTHCLQRPDCCAHFSEQNQFCYSAQCYATADAIAQALELTRANYTVSFQSRLGKEPWLQPYTSATLEKLAKAGKKRVRVFCPSFVCDCLETLYEIGDECAEEFHAAGGERLHLVHGLNDRPLWIEALKEIVLDHISQNPYSTKNNKRFEVEHATSQYRSLNGRTETAAGPVG